MRKRRILASAWRNLRRRRLRTLLTTLGVAVGITAMIALVSLGGGFRLLLEKELHEGFEVNVLTVMSGGILTGTGGEFTKEDVEKIEGIDGVVIASQLIHKPGIELYNEGRKKNSTAWVMLGVNLKEFWQIYPRRLVFENGSLPEQIRNNTMVLGYNVVHPSGGENFAYPRDDVTIQLTMKREGVLESKNYTFNVAGTLMKSGTQAFINFDNTIFVPIETVREIYGVETADTIFVKIEDPEGSESIAREIEKSFKPRYVWLLVPLTFIQQVESVLNMLRMFLLSTICVALLVAGLGIMNIMTVSVVERIREIGIMKAIGAKDRTILTMFLTEAALIGLMGGVAGVPAGYVIAYVLGVYFFRFRFQPIRTLITGSQTFESVTPVLTVQWIIGAVIFGLIVSIIFGWIPARKAAKLDPVEALRYE